MAYTTQAKAEAIAGFSFPAAFSAQFGSILASVKAYIDRYCGKTFEGAAETRYYDGNGSDEILIDAFTGVPTEVKILENDGTVISTLSEGSANDFVVLPFNSTEKNTIRLTGLGAYGKWPHREKSVHVQAVFGASVAVPADIELAASKLIAKLASGADESGGVASETLGDYSVTYKSVEDASTELGVTKILDQWRDIDI